MRYRQLGRSGLTVSELCLGTMMFGGETDEIEAGRIVASAREAGINSISTVDVHHDGRSEEIVGSQMALRWVLDNALVSAAIAGPLTLSQWHAYLAALEIEFTAEGEALFAPLVPAGHASTPGSSDPRYPCTGRRPLVGGPRSGRPPHKTGPDNDRQTVINR